MLPAMRNQYQNRRKRLRWTREKLAAEAGVSISTVVRAEGGKALIPVIASAIDGALTRAERKATA